MESLPLNGQHAKGQPKTWHRFSGLDYGLALGHVPEGHGPVRVICSPGTEAFAGAIFVAFPGPRQPEAQEPVLTLSVYLASTMCSAPTFS